MECRLHRYYSLCIFEWQCVHDVIRLQGTNMVTDSIVLWKLLEDFRLLTGKSDFPLASDS